MTTLNQIKLHPARLTQLKAIAASSGKSVQEFIGDFIERCIADKSISGSLPNLVIVSEQRGIEFQVNGTWSHAMSQKDAEKFASAIENYKQGQHIASHDFPSKTFLNRLSIEAIGRGVKVFLDGIEPASVSFPRSMLQNVARQIRLALATAPKSSVAVVRDGQKISLTICDVVLLEEMNAEWSTDTFISFTELSGENARRLADWLEQLLSARKSVGNLITLGQTKTEVIRTKEGFLFIQNGRRRRVSEEDADDIVRRLHGAANSILKF